MTPTVVFDLDKVILGGDAATLFLRGRLRQSPRRLLSLLLATPVLLPGSLTWRVAVPPGGEWTTTILVRPMLEDGSLVSPIPAEHSDREQARPVQRLHEWRRRTPVVVTPHRGLSATLRQSMEDLGAL
ncbi:MAG: hypothetical protein ACXVX3_16635, partial [Blastococcus sp.]